MNDCFVRIKYLNGQRAVKAARLINFGAKGYWVRINGIGRDMLVSKIYSDPQAKQLK